MTRIAIVGGGPGGLFTAYLLERYCSDLCQVTLFEAGPRLGGKVCTKQFTRAPALYEAGVAELYDYSHFGPDPIKQLIKQFGLATVPMSGPTVILGDAILRDDDDILRHFGPRTLRALEAFDQRCLELCCPADYYEGCVQDDNRHPWAGKTFREVLDEIPDETARKYIEVAVRSDVATEPHLTNALNGLKNVLMDDPRYLRLYSIQGGIERLIDKLKEQIKSQVFLESPVVRLARAEGGYRLTTRRQGRFQEHDFDYVVLALPNYWLSRLEWGSRELRQTIQKHLARYDNPAHYLRMTLLFQEPFWREQVPGSYFMMDAFGGCCVYDEGARHPCEPYGVLGWLLAGNDALALSNSDDDRLIDQALDSLPAPLAHGRELFLEGKVQRWVGTINGLPGGNPTQEIRQRHLPDPRAHPGLFLVGDYLFDSTINGVYDSADFVTDMVLARLRKKKYAARAAVPVNGHASANGAGERGASAPCCSAARPFRKTWSEAHTANLIRAVWGCSPPYRLLDSGSEIGLSLPGFAQLGIDAWGVEPDPAIHAHTPPELLERNRLGDARRLPFPDGAFDFVYDTSLCYLPEEELDQAIRELFRVCRVGVVFAGVAADLTREAIEAHQLFTGVRSLCTQWEWSEKFLAHGFRMAVIDLPVLDELWQTETAASQGGLSWYADPDALRHCFFSKPKSPNAQPAANGKAKRRRPTAEVKLS
jgi:monoamine oxidase/SAM-dependent methyltransferase